MGDDFNVDERLVGERRGVECGEEGCRVEKRVLGWRRGLYGEERVLGWRRGFYGGSRGM